MFNKLEEQQRVLQWLNKLNSHVPGWIHGDEESKDKKTVDFVNRSEKIAIELKREKGDNLDNKDRNTLILSNRIEAFVKDANNKLENYRGYRTCLIIELVSSIWSAQVVMSGVKQLHFVNRECVGTSIKNERLFSKMENIGAIIFWPAPGNLFNRALFFSNIFAKENCVMTQREIEQLLGNELEQLEII